MVFIFLVAEEGGSGKVALLEKGAYEGMDACLMYASFFVIARSAMGTDHI